MKVTTIPGAELDCYLVRRWRVLRQANPNLNSPYFLPDFTLIAAEVRDDVEIAVIEECNNVVGFFPFQRGRWRIATPVGGILSDYQGIISLPEFVCDPVELLKRCRLRAWDFSHLLASQQSFSPFHRLVEGSAIMDLSEGFSAYCRAKQNEGTQAIKDCERKARKLERESGPLRFEFHSSDKGALERIISWKSGQYVATGKPDLFRSNWIRSFVERVHSTQGEDFAGRLALLFAGDVLVAGAIGMWSGQTYHWWFPSYDRAYSRYSPGLVLLLKIAEYATDCGVKWIDLGKGESSYKARLMSYFVPVALGSVQVPSVLKVTRQIRQRARAKLAANRLTRGTYYYLREMGDRAVRTWA